MQKFLLLFVLVAGLLCMPLSHVNAADNAYSVELDKSKLIQSAIDYQKHSYAPYSHFNVSAAVLMSTGKIYNGVNIENASYGVSICAEDVAIYTAIADNKDAYIVAIVIIGGPNYTIKDYCPPCGISRQCIREFYKPGVTRVILAKSITDYKDFSLDDLLPMSFGPDALERTRI